MRSGVTGQTWDKELLALSGGRERRKDSREMKSRKQASGAAVDPTGVPGSREPRPTGLSAEEIRMRACEIYVERGRTDGHDLDDWFQAEKELTEALRKLTSN
jgi:hypothetical protein